jgi:hypothetical protein
MAHKQVLFRSTAREKVLRGATQLCDAVRVTLGPKSKSVLIQKTWGSPIGGLALIRCIDVVGQEEAKCEGDERTGVQVLKRARAGSTDASDRGEFRG